MLVLSRKANENIVIDGRIIVKVVRIEGGTVRLGIEAPADVAVHRQEIYEQIQKGIVRSPGNARGAVPGPAATPAPATIPGSPAITGAVGTKTN